MLPIVSGRDGDRIKIEVTVDLSGGMLEAEDAILGAVNAVGNVATAEALKKFDADGDHLSGLMPPRQPSLTAGLISLKRFD